MSKDLKDRRKGGRRIFGGKEVQAEYTASAKAKARAGVVRA